MAPETCRKRSETSGPTGATLGQKAEQARAELVLLATQKLRRLLTEAEHKEIQRLGEPYLGNGYYAQLYKGYNRCELLDWFSSAARIREDLNQIQRQRDAITASQIEQACAEAAHIAAANLGRLLTGTERKVIRGCDKSLLVDGDIADLFQGYSPQELQDFLTEAGAGPGAVTLLNSLANMPFGIEQCKERVREFLSPKGRKVLAGVDFGKAVEDFSRWLLETLRTDSPARNIRALYFGLFEVKGGCGLSVSGARAYDEEDSDWACTGDWSPKDHCAPFDQVSKMWRQLRKTENEPWVFAQAIGIMIVRAFFEKHRTEFKQLTGLKRAHIACGFDDGDLYELRTAISPRA